MKRTRRIAWGAGLFAIAALLVLLVMRPDVISLELAVVEPGPLSVTIDEDGITRFRKHEEVSAPVSGRLLASDLRAGDSVVRGAVIARIAPAPLDERARAQAEAALAVANSAREQAEARARQAEVLLDQARRERSRAERLGAAGALSARTLEDALANERVREREVEASRSSVDAARQYARQVALALLGAGVAPSTALVDVRAPIGGRVLRVLEEHERVVLAGTPLLEVGQPDEVEIEVNVLSDDAARIAAGTPMLGRVPGLQELEAVVSRVEPSAFTKVSPLGVEEQRVNVIGKFRAAPTGLGDRFRVSVSIVLWSAESVMAVPSTSLVPLDEGWGVFTVDDGRARLRPVELGHHGARLVEIVRGLDAGELIIRHPDERVREGTRVSGR